MYDTLRPDLLTATEAQRQQMRLDPTAVVSYSLFKGAGVFVEEMMLTKLVDDSAW